MKDRLRMLRKYLDLTQQEFGEKIGVKRNTIAQYEMGRNEPIDSVFSLICKEYNVNPEWLRSGTGEMFVELDRDEQLMEWAGSVLGSGGDAFKYRFVRMLSNLSEKDWEVLQKISVELADEKKKD